MPYRVKRISFLSEDTVPWLGRLLVGFLVLLLAHRSTGWMYGYLQLLLCICIAHAALLNHIPECRIVKIIDMACTLYISWALHRQARKKRLKHLTVNLTPAHIIPEVFSRRIQDRSAVKRGQVWRLKGHRWKVLIPFVYVESRECRDHRCDDFSIPYICVS